MSTTTLPSKFQLSLPKSLRVAQIPRNTATVGIVLDISGEYLRLDRVDD